MSTTVGTPGAIPAPPASAAYLGQGIAYPMSFNPNTGRLNIANGATKVLQGLQAILDTQPGERPMQPDFGANVGTFEPIDAGRTQIKLQSSVADHEPRVRSVTVRADIGQDTNEQVLSITAEIIGQATPQTLTAPYFVGPL